MPTRPRLTPAMADVRRAVRECWLAAGVQAGELVLVGVSGGPDSMALAAAAAFEGPRAGIRVGAVVVEHGLQEITKSVAESVVQKCTELGMSPVDMRSVKVDGDGGPEAAARAARYAAFDFARTDHGARFVMLGHTLNDQAETVLMGLARGSGARSISGMREVSENYLRPLLSISRETTEQFCIDSGIEVWHDPQNTDPSFLRVRVRHEVLPLLEQTMGPGVLEALARTAQQLRADNFALEEIAKQVFAQQAHFQATSIEIEVLAIQNLAVAIRIRVLKLCVEAAGGTATAANLQTVDELITNWHGQKTLTLAGVRVERTGPKLVFRSTKTLKPGAC